MERALVVCRSRSTVNKPFYTENSDMRRGPIVPTQISTKLTIDSLFNTLDTIFVYEHLRKFIVARNIFTYRDKEEWTAREWHFLQFRLLMFLV